MNSKFFFNWSGMLFYFIEIIIVIFSLYFFFSKSFILNLQKKQRLKTKHYFMVNLHNCSQFIKQFFKNRDTSTLNFFFFLKNGNYLYISLKQRSIFCQQDMSTKKTFCRLYLLTSFHYKKKIVSLLVYFAKPLTKFILFI